jgi:hypothetical protein
MSSYRHWRNPASFEANSVNWLNIMCGYTYILLKKDASSKQLITALNKITATFKSKDAQDKSGSNLVFSQLLILRQARISEQHRQGPFYWKGCSRSFRLH